MSTALRQNLAAFTFLLASAILPTSLLAESPPPEVLVVVERACGERADGARLARALSLRLPDLQIAAEESPHGEPPLWMVHWRPDKTCQVKLISLPTRSTQGSWPLPAGADEEDLLFAASRLSWMISLEEEEGLFGAPESGEELPEASAPPEALPLSETSAVKEEKAILEEELSEDEILKDEENEEKSPDLFPPLRTLFPDEISRPAEAPPSEESELSPPLRTLFPDAPPAPAEEQPSEADPAPSSSSPESLSERTRITLFPGLVIRGEDLEKPSLSLNGVGRNDRFHGVEMGVFNLIDDQALGFQFGLLGNHIQGPIRGFQLAGIANSAGALRGVQMAGTFNLVSQEIRGVQFASGFNHAARGQGLQASPLLNHVHDEWKGLQLGLLNIAHHVQGSQIGLVNIARSSSAPIGLVNVIIDHPPRMKLWASLPGYNYASLETGGKNLRYALLFGNRFDAQAPNSTGRRVLGFGLGWRFHLEEPFFLDLEAALLAQSHRLNRIFEDGGSIQQLRASLGWRLHPRFAPVAGLGLTRMQNGDESFLSPWALPISDQAIWPELILGVLF